MYPPEVSDPNFYYQTPNFGGNASSFDFSTDYLMGAQNQTYTINGFSLYPSNSNLSFMSQVYDK